MKLVFKKRHFAGSLVSIRGLRITFLSCIIAMTALAQLAQQGSKLAGMDSIGRSQQGQSVAISADGNTAIVGGAFDAFDFGAAWVFTRASGVWSQQGAKLIGTGVSGTNAPLQGWSVALSGDGNTALVGGVEDNAEYGATWVFTRSDGVWTQQGGKLAHGSALAGQGWSVALSADGNTALIGAVAYSDLCCSGAVSVFRRSGDAWTPQGDAIAGNAGALGSSVALSADGNTALVGDPADNGWLGAAYVFTRNGDVWSQQAKLVGASAIGASGQGSSAAISADGNTAIIGGPADNANAGAAWVFRRTDGVWNQEGDKLVGASAVGAAAQGASVTISGDGNTAIIGGPADNASAGAAWVFTRTSGVWSQQAEKLTGAGAIGNARQGTSVAMSGDAATAIVGGSSDNFGVGAAWVFAAPGLSCGTSTPQVIALVDSIASQDLRSCLRP